MTTPQSTGNYQSSIRNPFEDEAIDAKRYLSLFISNWYWFALTLLLALSVTYGVNRWSEKIYNVSSTLLIKDDKFLGTNAAISTIFPGTESFKNLQNLKNEIGILKSFNLNYRVMKALPDFHIDYTAIGKRGIVESKLYKDCPFIVVYDSIEKQNIGEKVSIKILSEKNYRIYLDGVKNFSEDIDFGERFKKMGFNFIIEHRNPAYNVFDANSSNKYYFSFNNLFTLANSYRNKLNVAPIEEDASLVTLTSSGLVLEQEADYLNMLMDVYLAYGLEVKNQTAGQTISFIEDQLGLISDSLHKAEGKLESFRLNNKLIDISKEGGVIQDKLAKIDAEKTSLQLQENYYNYLKKYVESKSESEDIIAPYVMGITDQLLIKLVDELSRLQQEKKHLAMNLNESGNPLKIVEANIINTREAMADNITSGLQNMEQLKTDVDERMIKVEQEIRKLPSTEKQMINIQRKFDINNTVYTFLLEKQAEAGIAKASNVPDNRIIDYASSFSSSRIKPKERKNLVIAVLLSIFLPVSLIVIIDYLNNKIIDKKDIEKRTSVPILGFISHSSLRSEIPVVEKLNSTISESFRGVRTNLKYFIKNVKCPVISVTSTISGEGKTFISANLAAILAVSGKKVLLIGLDLRKPRIHKIFNLQNENGMSNFLIGQEQFENVLVKTDVANLWYAQSGPVPPNPAELIESPEMGRFIENAKEVFDYIVIDTPPVAIVTDALLISPLTDFYIFVVRQRYSSKNTLDLIEELNKNENIKSIGIIINDINVSGYYGYGLRYGYSMGYGYYYGYNYYGHNNYGGYSQSSKSYYTED